MFQFGDDDNFDFDFDVDLENVNMITPTSITSMTRAFPQGRTEQKENIQTRSSPALNSYIKPIIEKVEKEPKVLCNVIQTKTEAVKRRDPSSPQKQSPSASKLKYVRKFPGPAGIILLDATKECINQGELSAYPANECNDMFEINWPSVLSHLDLNFLSVEDLCGIFRAKSKLGQLRTLTSRVPFLIVAIKEVEQTLQDASCLLVDTSGEMLGSIHQPVVDQFGKHLRKGSVIFLHNTCLLSPKQSPQKAYLSITIKSLVAIYSPPERIVTKLQPYTRDEVLSWIAEASKGPYVSNSSTDNLPQEPVRVAEKSANAGNDDIIAKFLDCEDDDLFNF